MKPHDDDLIRMEGRAQQVAQALRDRINVHRSPDEVPPAGEYGPGDQLPSELQLLEEFKPLSRNTIRAAIRMLVGEGLLTVEQGRGTFVRVPPVRLRFGRWAVRAQVPGRGPWESVCAAQGVNGWTETVTVDHRGADVDVARGLEVPLGTMVVRRLLYLHADDAIIQIQVIHLPLDIVAGSDLAEREKGTDGLYVALERLGHEAVQVTEEVFTRPATYEEAAVFGVPGAHVLVMRRQSYDTAGRCVALGESVSLGDRIVLVYDKIDRSWNLPPA